MLFDPSQKSKKTTTTKKGRSHLNNLLQGLKSDDEIGQLQAVMELCDFLSIGTEDNMSNFSVDLFVPALVNLLQLEHNPEIMRMEKKKLFFLSLHFPFPFLHTSLHFPINFFFFFLFFGATFWDR